VKPLTPRSVMRSVVSRRTLGWRASQASRSVVWRRRLSPASWLGSLKRLYSMKMFSCDYQDLVNPRAKTRDEATPFIGKVVLEGCDVDAKRSFMEMYASNPEPRIPVWITYHWKVFRAKGTTARVTVSDWPNEKEVNGVFGQEQTFNFLEIQPYHE